MGKRKVKSEEEFSNIKLPTDYDVIGIAKKTNVGIVFNPAPDDLFIINGNTQHINLYVFFMAQAY